MGCYEIDGVDDTPTTRGQWAWTRVGRPRPAAPLAVVVMHARTHARTHAHTRSKHTAWCKGGGLGRRRHGSAGWAASCLHRPPWSPAVQTLPAPAPDASSCCRLFCSATVAVTSDVKLSYKSLLYCMGVFWDKLGGSWTTVAQRWRNLGIPPEVRGRYCHCHCRCRCRCRCHAASIAWHWHIGCARAVQRPSQGR